jgi:formylglycine-generating enzyme required for sulfatase activity
MASGRNEHGRDFCETMKRSAIFLAALATLTAMRSPTVNAEELTNSIGIKLVRIEAGSFLMGQDGPPADYNVKGHAEKFDDADWDERPVHRVTISRPFFIGSTEVTLGQYRQFKPGYGKGADDEAVTGASWSDAVGFCEWLSKKEGKMHRLPTEAEWEYACRAGTKTIFNTGDALPAGFQPWTTDTGLRDRFFPNGTLPPDYRATGGRAPVRVAQTPANAWGLFDMHGNVAEWCADWYGPYESAEQTDPLGRADGDFRVIRGGSHSMQTRHLRSANRSGWLPETAHDRTGFRVVLGEWPTGQRLPKAEPPLNARDVVQTAVEIAPAAADVPVFSGPQPFAKIPPQSFGPLFSGHNHSPAIAECPNGDLLAVWYSCVDEAGSELCNLASRLRRGAKEWEPASPFWDGPDVNDHAPKLWWDGEKTLFHFARGLDENIVRTSTDNGATWSKARTIQPVCEFGNAPIRTREGFMVITTDTTVTGLNISRDQGETWTFPMIEDRTKANRNGSGARHIGIHAPIVQLADRRLMTIGRTDDAAQQEKIGLQTPVSFTSDWGKTWTYGTLPFPAISSVQRAVLMRLREGPLLLCSFTDQSRDWNKRKGMAFQSAAGTEFTGYGLFAAVSFDEGKTWPVRRLVTPGGAERKVNGIDRNEFTLSATMAEPRGYLAATQTRDGNIQLISSKNHYVFNLAWLKQLPPAP